MSKHHQKAIRYYFHSRIANLPHLRTKNIQILFYWPQKKFLTLQFYISFFFTFDLLLFFKKSKVFL